MGNIQIEVLPMSLRFLSEMQRRLVKMISMHQPVVPHVRKFVPNFVCIERISSLKVFWVVCQSKVDFMWKIYYLIFNSLVAKNRYNLPFYGIYSGFFFFTLFGNLFPAFTFFLNVFHPAFRDELVVCPETAGIMQGIGQLVTFI